MFRAVLLLAFIVMPAVAQAQTCRASYYGAGERLNRHTASGEIFRPTALTAAHRTLPFNSRVRVTHAGKSVVVRINDRGPAKRTGRCIDVSRETARQLGMIHKGVAKVRIEVLQ